MSNLPNFDHQGYQVIQKLGHNYQGGRITYKAINLNTQQPVVIKQFRFATGSSDWSGNKAVEREIQVLRSLNHPGIPRYLDSFDPGDGICLVQDYKNAQPLSAPRSFDPDEIKCIAVSVLEILVYLQNRIPPVIHRDIKPENVLVDDRLNVYLVDFGFARIGGGEVAALSSMVAGTTGFMPPEQLLNRPLTEASDLYGLAATLICLLTGTKSTEITNLIDSSFRINFKHLVPKLSLRFIEWLEKMVQPNFNDRFENAEAALKALKPIYVIRIPETRLSQSSLEFLEFKATRLGERLTQTITVRNFVPETVLEGTWEVAPHPHDPPHTPEIHAWIKFAPAKFTSNLVECRVVVDTSQLMADKTYKRQILLHTNSATETYSLTIKIKTAAFPLATKEQPYFRLALLLVISWAVGVVAGGGVAIVAWIWAGIVAVSGAIDGAVAAAETEAGVLEVFVDIAFALLTTAFGLSLGIAFKLGFLNPFVIFAILVTGLPFTTMIPYPAWQRLRLIAKHRKSEQHLIKP